MMSVPNDPVLWVEERAATGTPLRCIFAQGEGDSSFSDRKAWAVGDSSCRVTNLDYLVVDDWTEATGATEFTFTYNSFVPVMENVVYDDDPELIVLAYSANDATTGLLLLEFYPDFGATIGPQTFTFTGENYADCHTCILAFICDPGCNQTFLVQAGTLEVAAAGTGDGDPFTATLTDVEMIEVTIDPVTFVSTPVIGGETWQIPTMNLSSTTTLAP